MKNRYLSLILLVSLLSCSDKEPSLEMVQDLSTIEMVGTWQIEMVITDFHRNYQEDATSPQQSITETMNSDDEVSQVAGSISFEEGNTGFFTVKNSRSLMEFDKKEFTWEIEGADLIKVYFPKYWSMEWDFIEINDESLSFTWLFDDTSLDLFREIKMIKL